MLRISGRMRRASGGLVAAGAAVVLLFWYFESRLPAIPQRPLRIGFEHNPPVQIRADIGFTGLAVETVNEAAKRAGVRLQWVETGTSSDEAFQKGLVDLWPLMADLPDRRKYVHFTRPWLHSSHALLLRAGSAFPDPGFTGRIALFKMPLHVRLLRRKFSGAQLVEFTDVNEVVSAVCRGAVDAGFLEGRVALTALRERPSECSSVALRVQILRDLTLQHGIASTFAAAGAAEAMRREISNMFRDGTLALTIAKYSYYGLDDTWATYDLMEASERARWMAWGIGVLVMVLTVTLWRAGSLRQRKRVGAVRSHLAAIVESSDDAIIGQTLDGLVVSWNPGAERIYGYKAEEMLGRPLSLLVPPDGSDEIRERLERLRHGEGFQRFETTCVGKDGRRIEVSVTISPIHDGTGAVVGAAVIAHNITEQAKARDLLRKSEERLKTAERLAHVGNWEWDMKTDRMVWSEEVCRIFSRPDDYTTDYAGFLQAVQPHDRERVVQYVRGRMAGKSPNLLEFQITRPDGGVRTISSIAEAVRDERGLPVRLLGAWQDVTDQKLAEAALRRSLDEVAHLNRVAAMGELAASLAHELNQPLAAILSNAQAANRFLNRESPDVAQVRECLTAIVADDKRAGEVIKRLRGLLKKGEFQPSSVDLNEVVSDAIQLARNDALRRRVSIKFEPLLGLPPVLGDRIQLYQVVLNLIMNGLEAAVERPPEDRWVLARAVEADGCRVELTVEDSGRGVAEGDLSRVFEAFFSTKQGGLGMGLSICRSIVEVHGGRIWAERHAGTGAVFRCLLPVAQQVTAASAK